jgi:hypothetical protein
MLCREIIAVCSEISKKHKYSVGRTYIFFLLNLAVQIVRLNENHER